MTIDNRDNHNPVDQSGVGVEDTSQKKGFLKKFGILFASGTPHSGFNKLVVFLAVISLITWWWWSTSDDEEALSLGNTTTSELSERDDKKTTVPDKVVDQILTEDADKADAARVGKGNYAGVRPDRGTKPLSEVLSELKAKPTVSLPEPVEPEIAPIADFKPAFSNLDLNAAKTTSDTRKTNKDLNTKPAEQVPANPLMAYALKLKEEQDKGNSSDTAPVFNGSILITSKVSSETQSNGAGATKTTGSKLQSPTSTNAATNPMAGGSSNTASTDADKGVNQILALRQGHFAYGYTITAVDTDVEAQEVVAEIGGGLLHGARLIGSWKRLGNWYEDLSLVFNTMEFNKEVYSVNLIAFNNSTHLPAFVDDVDRHILMRWGGLISGSLLEAAKVAAEASAGSTETYNASTTTSTVTRAGLSDNDVKAVLLTSTGSQIAEKLKGLFDRPITSRVFVGRDLRLLAMEPVLIKRTP
ncbi:DotG/IcmE/VirB10 family protein [uncultured Amphritea sp.]|uniref:DotG/IcmE/VirB10 family protein n=1 Tax=uncultured Amphritea sp. TaxID=981605 RepID=UPI00260D89B6|nr:DotG/IcmE/VirB10 family protein [uncultured Amphritea sp.]